MIILDLCGGTGAWSRPYAAAGYRVIIVDPYTVGSVDVRLFERISDPVHGILAAPPCTVFANSGARWPRTEQDIREGLSVVDACFRIITVHRPRFWALENPIGKLKRYLGEPTLRFHPFHYGDPYPKLTCLWGDFNIPKRNEVPVENKEYIHNMPDTKKRAMLPSVTPPGFAQAFFEVNR